MIPGKKNETADPRRRQLVELGAEKLADILLDFAHRNDEIDDCVDWMVASRETRLALVKAKIAGLHGLHDFIDWRHAAEFERNVSVILDEIKSLDPPPETGLLLVADFFRTDSAVIEGCDSDSTGMIYEYDAAELFAEFAKRCEQKTSVMDLLIELLGDDDYSVRDSLLKHAAEFLSKANLKVLFERLQKDPEELGTRGNLAELAKQMKDVELFIRLNSDPKTGELPNSRFLPIAELCYDCGKYQDAMSWLQKIPREEYVPSDFKKKLFAKLGMNREVEALYRKSFFSCPSPETLAELLKAVGRDKKQTVIAEAMEKFSGEEYFSTERMNFMLMHGGAEAAAAYVIPRWRKVDGNNYAALNQLWPVMKRKGAPLAATIILRALLDSILERKKAKAYYYGAEYWHELEGLASTVQNWFDLPSHKDYTDKIRSDHKRKHAFWAEVNP